MEPLEPASLASPADYLSRSHRPLAFRSASAWSSRSVSFSAISVRVRATNQVGERRIEVLTETVGPRAFLCRCLLRATDLA